MRVREGGAGWGGVDSVRADAFPFASFRYVEFVDAVEPFVMGILLVLLDDCLCGSGLVEDDVGPGLGGVVELVVEEVYLDRVEPVLCVGVV